jgi:hypothetical protein
MNEDWDIQLTGEREERTRVIIVGVCPAMA